MWLDLFNAGIGTATLFFTFVIYLLGRRLTLRATMERRSDVERELREFMRRIYSEGQNCDPLFINAARYARGDYTAFQNGEQAKLSWRGALFVGGEAVGLRHDGLEVLPGSSAPGHPDALEMWFVPFDRVEWVNLDGDENFNRVIVFVSFGGPYPVPCAYSYPVERRTYKLREGGRDYYRRVDGAPLRRSAGIRAWLAAAGLWRRAIRFARDDHRASRLVRR